LVLCATIAFSFRLVRAMIVRSQSAWSRYRLSGHVGAARALAFVEVNGSSSTVPSPPTIKSPISFSLFIPTFD
jgi:hypothetical protein